MIRQIFDTLLRLEKNSIKVNNSSVSTDNPIPVTLIAGSGSTTADRELITTTYICKNAFSGASVNDTITSTQILDVAGVPVNIATIWRNQTTASDFAFVPSSTDLTLLGTGTTSTALTNTELRATPVTFRMDQTTPGTTNRVDIGNDGVVALTPAQLATLTPLTGFNLETTQALIKAKTDNIDVALSTRLKPSDTLTKVATVDTITNVVNVSDNGGSLTVDAVSLPLPTGAATSALQSTQDASINSLLKPASTLNAVTTLGTITNALPTGTNSIGQVTANAGTNLNTSLLALDSTVAKDASLTTLNTSVNTLLKPASTLAAVTSITNTVTVKADTLANQTNAFKVDGSAVTQPISATALPLSSKATTFTVPGSYFTSIHIKR